jgi:hypothetical protein
MCNIWQLVAKTTVYINGAPWIVVKVIYDSKSACAYLRRPGSLTTIKFEEQDLTNCSLERQQEYCSEL